MDPKNPKESSRRQRRSVSYNSNVEVLVVADESMVNHYHDQSVETYVLTIMNIVSIATVNIFQALVMIYCLLLHMDQLCCWQGSVLECSQRRLSAMSTVNTRVTSFFLKMRQDDYIVGWQAVDYEMNRLHKIQFISRSKKSVYFRSQLAVNPCFTSICYCILVTFYN